MLRVAVLLLVVSAVVVIEAKCVCYGANCAFYTGTEPQCFCWCNNEVARGKVGGRCTFFPHAQFSSGGCSFCPVSMAGNETVIEASPLSPAISALAASTDPEAASVEVLNMNTVYDPSAGAGAPGPFLVTRCFCPNVCTQGYHGTYDACLGWVKQQKDRFLGDYQWSYFPWSQFSSGGCKVCGPVDPCKL